jgi:hypothetical protein
LNQFGSTIPQIADLIYGFRNNRNVGHVGVIIVNEMDATFVLNAAKLDNG